MERLEPTEPESMEPESTSGRLLRSYRVIRKHRFKPVHGDGVTH